VPRRRCNRNHVCDPWIPRWGVAGAGSSELSTPYAAHRQVQAARDYWPSEPRANAHCLVLPRAIFSAQLTAFPGSVPRSEDMSAPLSRFLLRAFAF
jgi:hypothetical protein